MVFAWNILVFDDDPTSQGIENLSKGLTKIGFNVTIVEGGSKFSDATFVSEVKRAHIAMIDLHWNAQEVYPTKLIASEDIEDINKARFPFDTGGAIWNEADQEIIEWVKKYLVTLRVWVDEHAPAKTNANLYGWPKVKIDAQDVGVYFGCLLSYVAPHLKQVFYSSKPNVWASGPIVAVRNYNNAAFSVETKAETAFSWGKIDPLLREVQREILSRESSVRDWVIGKVFLPLSLGCQPVPEELTIYSHGSKRFVDYVFEPQSFFPHLNNENNSGVALDKIVGLLGRVTPNPETLERLALAEHDIGPDKPQNVDSLKSVLRQCYSVGDVALDIAGAITRAIDCLKNKNTDNAAHIMEGVWRDLWAMRWDCRCWLTKLCREYRGSFDPEIKWPTTGDSILAQRQQMNSQKWPVLNLSELGSLFENLRTNQVKRKCHYSLQGSVTGEGHVQLIWKGQWNSEDRIPLSHRTFEKAAMEKIKKGGPHTGLPFVLLAAIKNADEVYLGVGSDGWHQIYPKKAEEEASDLEESYYYLKLVFYKRNSTYA
ncbi:MAG: hypothetical protein KAV87_22160 [Desulfobacteraceae bacterium]|nr:hypothetical protein [Desulfobacteraceae bacterium]